MKFREMEKEIMADGWRLDRTEGSHHHYKHPTKKGVTTISKHSGDLSRKTVQSIRRQAGLLNRSKK
jgi:predicted RNA binding protein YcfA (HicA-like mRNA interferase family)